MLPTICKHYYKAALVTTLFIIPCFTTAAEQKKDIPIVLVHGILADRFAMKPTEDFIRKYLGKDV